MLDIQFFFPLNKSKYIMLYGFTYIYSSYIGYLGYKMNIHIFCRILKYVAGYWNYHIQSILAQNRDHGPMNLT